MLKHLNFGQNSFGEHQNLPYIYEALAQQGVKIRIEKFLKNIMWNSWRTFVYKECDAEWYSRISWISGLTNCKVRVLDDEIEIKHLNLSFKNLK